MLDALHKIVALKSEWEKLFLNGYAREWWPGLTQGHVAGLYKPNAFLISQNLLCKGM